MEIDYDRSYISNEIYQITDEMPLRLKGKREAVSFVAQEINRIISEVKIRTFNINSADSKYIKDRISHLKAAVDPAEMRVSFKTKTYEEYNHPFYLIPNYHREGIFIGSEQQLK